MSRKFCCRETLHKQDRGSACLILFALLMEIQQHRFHIVLGIAPWLVHRKTAGGWPPSLMSTLLLFFHQESSKSFIIDSHNLSRLMEVLRRPTFVEVSPLSPLSI